MKKRWICGILAMIMTVGLLSGVQVRAEEIPDMKVSAQLIEVLKEMEGFYSYPQWDYAQWTVGYGTRCPDDKLNYWTKDNPITEAEALALLDAEMPNYEVPVNKFLKKYGLKLNQHQYDALVSFTYNCGAGWTTELTGYFNTAVRQGDMSNAFLYGICLFSKAGDNYILQRRRLSEANMYINGEYKSYTNGNSYPSHFKYVFLDGNGGSVSYPIHGYNAADPAGVVTDFAEIPTGVDSNGNWFVYEFAGWFTEPVGGTQVTALDGSLSSGAILYAQWKDPSGQIVPLPKGELVNHLTINVTSNVNVRTGPATFYPTDYTIKASAQSPKTVTITEVFTTKSNAWGKFADGWINLAYTNYQSVVNSQPGEPFPRAATLTGDGVNYRVDHDVNSESKGMLSAGTKLIILEEYWDQVNNRLWGKMDSGYWICINNKGSKYVTYDSELTASAIGISMKALPNKLQYVQRSEEIDITGSVLVTHYSDGSIKARTLAKDQVKNFDNTTTGTKNVTVGYQGYQTSFSVEIIQATVTFRNYDGTILSSAQYEYGAAVAVPGVPAKPEDERGQYIFTGWDKEVTACKGNAVYTAVFKLIAVTPDTIPGDFNLNDVVNEDDAIYLLWHVMQPERYPVAGNTDVNADGLANEDDAIYLLWHVMQPDRYPLVAAGNVE